MLACGVDATRGEAAETALGVLAKFDSVENALRRPSDTGLRKRPVKPLGVSIPTGGLSAFGALLLFLSVLTRLF
jgi:hypothetical protein